ncbi:MAG: carboxypeptidase-like regulatory domain-containing protein, partial [Candidatus Acidiferrales bacterium]
MSLDRPMCKAFFLGMLAGVLLIIALLSSSSLFAQSTFTSQLSGVVTDSSGGVIPGAKITLTDVATNIPTETVTNAHGIYVLTGLRPATYTIRAEAASFGAQERKDVVLQVSQDSTINFQLTPSSVSVVVKVTGQAPLLDTGNASLGTDVTNEYVRDIPLVNRSMFGLLFLAGGVTESAGSGINDSYPSGTNFISNGQRNSTAEVRMDGALLSAPEQ